MTSKSVYTAARREGKVFWTRIGTCDVMPDGELLVRLDAVPVSGELRIREEEPRAVAPYVTPSDRYVVTFRIGYTATEAESTREAAERAANLIAGGTCCQVHDHETGTTEDFELSARQTYDAIPWTGEPTARE
jgi:hypothetical protein